jgi:UDPglucose 6-dehydrogenase
MREAPALEIIQALQARGARLTAYDPVAMDEAQRVLGPREGLSYSSNAMQALEGADALLLVTEWKEFRNPDFDAIKGALKQPVVFDGRNQYEPALMKAFGMEHHGIGRGLALE